MDHRINQVSRENLTGRSAPPPSQCAAAVVSPKENGPPPTDQILSIIDAAIERVAAVVGLSDSVGNQLMGDLPPRAGTDGPSGPASPAGRIPLTLYKLETLHTAITYLENSVNRLTRV